MRRGMASIIAVVMIGLVAIALVTLGTVFVSQLKRTKAAATDAQLRQMLIAGAVMATQMAQDDRDVALPNEMGNEGATLHVKVHRDGDRATAAIDAKWRERVLRETIRMERRDSQWKIVDTNLGDQPPASTQPSDRSTAASQRS